jgi:cation transporter-like permease
MQNTRLSTAIDRGSRQFKLWIENPWRRTSAIIISLLFGNFFASVLSTSTGQKAELDIILAALVLGTTETISWLTYGSAIGRRRDENNALLGQRPLWIGILNGVKIGTIYGLFVEAFKLGS